MYWKTKNGQKTHVSQMTTRHIRNALNMLKRAGYTSPKTISFYLTCPEPLGEQAGYLFDEEFDMVMDSPVTEWIDIFEEELERRKVFKIAGGIQNEIESK